MVTQTHRHTDTNTHTLSLFLVPRVGETTAELDQQLDLHLDDAAKSDLCRSVFNAYLPDYLEYGRLLLPLCARVCVCYVPVSTLMCVCVPALGCVCLSFVDSAVLNLRCCEMRTRLRWPISTQRLGTRESGGDASKHKCMREWAHDGVSCGR